MAPIQYKKFCSKEDIEVPNDEIVKGYEVEKKKFAVVEKEELDEVQKSVGEGDRSIDVLQFVDFGSLNPALLREAVLRGARRRGARRPTPSCATR